MKDQGTTRGGFWMERRTSDEAADAAKEEMLSRLEIDRSAPHHRTGVPVPFVVTIAAVAALAGAAIASQLVARSASANGLPLPPSRAPAPREAVAPVVASPPGSSTAPAAETRAQAAALVLDAAGYITARRIATVSAEITGRIVEVDVEEGTEVSSGQVLARLDDTIAEVNARLAAVTAEAVRARVQSIEADLSEAQRVLARSEELLLRKLTSEAETTRDRSLVARLTADLRSSQAEFKVAALELERQRALLDDHTIRAPFAGIVTQKNAQPGEIVSPNSAGGGFTRSGICTVVDMDSLEIEVDVNEAFIGRVFRGQRVVASLDAYPDWKIAASVAAIIPTADRSKATVRVRIKINQLDERILPDMGVKVSFIGAKDV